MTVTPARTGHHSVQIGCAGWALRPQYAEHFAADGTHLQRYASTFNAAEINSSFFRPHRRATYERWADSVPADFRFSVKLPKEITHVRRFADADEPLDRFLGEISGLGGKLGPVLVQLPPKFEFDAELASIFIGSLRNRFSGDIVWEPRHASWFAGEVESLFGGHGVGRVAADPAMVPEAAEPGGWAGITYFRLHGSPRIYYSRYTADFIRAIAERVRTALEAGGNVWCIFDNTALGAATGDALSLKSELSQLIGVNYE